MNLKANQRKLILCLFILIAAAILIAPSAIFADVTEINYLALGDSLADGMTPYRDLDDGYPDYIADKMSSEGYSVEFNNLGKSGYTTEDIKAQLSGIQGLIAEADVITLDVGANDVLDLVKITEAGELIYDQNQIRYTIGYVVGPNVAEIISNIRAVNPNAKIYLMGYYNGFPYLPVSTQVDVVKLIGGLNSTLEYVAKTAGVEFVPTDEVIAKKATKYLPNPENIHPNEKGYKVIATEFWKVINNDFSLDD